MDGTTFTQLTVCQEDAGAVFPYLEGIAFLYVSFTYFTVADMQMSGYTVDIEVGDKEGGTRQPIATKTGAIVTESSEPGALGYWRNTFHNCPPNPTIGMQVVIKKVPQFSENLCNDDIFDTYNRQQPSLSNRKQNLNFSGNPSPPAECTHTLCSHKTSQNFQSLPAIRLA